MADLTIRSTNFQKGVTHAWADDAYHQYGPMIAGEDLDDGSVVYLIAAASAGSGSRLMLASAAADDAAARPIGIVPKGAKAGQSVTCFHRIRAAGILGGTDGGRIYLSDTPGALSTTVGTVTVPLGFFFSLKGQNELLAALEFPASFVRS